MGSLSTDMLEAMGQLTVEERDLLIQRYVDNRKLVEIAQSLGCSSETARRLCTAALEKLHRFLKRE